MVKNKSGGKRFHSLAEQTREEGKLLAALENTDKATIAYQEEGDMAGLAEIQASRMLTFRHLYEKTGEKKYLILARFAAEASVEIARSLTDKSGLAIPLFNLAKIRETLGELPGARDAYRETVEAMENNPPADHDRPAVLADVRGHLATCEYVNGDETALERAEQALADLESAEELSYNKNVWLSGAQMRIAKAVNVDDPEKAREYLREAKKIIDEDKRLKLRLEQWEKLVKRLGVKV